MNEEYLSYVDYLKTVNFEARLNKLKEEFGDKKILLFGSGVLLDVILDNYKITEMLNIIGISDSKFEHTEISEYKGIKVYKPMALRALNINVILDTNIGFIDTKKFLNKKGYVRKNVIVEPLVKISVLDKLKSFFEKQKALAEFLITNGNPFLTAYYAFVCDKEEIISKTNYIKKIKKIRKSKAPIRTVFIVDDVNHSDFMGLYNLLYFDKDFKIFPIIITPQQLLENDVVDEEKMQKRVEFFNTFNTKVIDGWDRELKSIPSLHAFKPDLIFYQNPIYIKDDYCPYVMSKNSVTFTIEYDVRNANFASIGSKYFKKQASNLWKIFVNNLEDKNLYSEYVGLAGKDIVNVVNKNINTGVVKYLKKSLNRSC